MTTTDDTRPDGRSFSGPEAEILAAVPHYPDRRSADQVLEELGAPSSEKRRVLSVLRILADRGLVQRDGSWAWSQTSATMQAAAVRRAAAREARREVATLAAWKADALESLGLWERCAEGLDLATPETLGRHKSEAVLQELERLRRGREGGQP